MAIQKIILVTGCNAGLGREILMHLNQQCKDCDIVYTCRDNQKIELVQSFIPKDSSNRIVGHAVDFSSLASVDQFTAEIKKRYPRLDYLFLNAGVHKPAFTKELTLDGIELHLQVNFIANAQMILALIDLLKKKSSICIVSSTANQPNRLNPWHYWYAKSKRLLLEFSLNIAQIYQNIAIKNLAPRFMMTEMHRYKPKLYHTLSRHRSNDIRTEAKKMIEITFDENQRELYYEFGKPKSLLIENNTLEIEEHLSVLRDIQIIPTYNPFNVLFFCKKLLSLSSVKEIQEIVQFARENRRCIRVIGSTQSYNDIFMNDDICLSLEKLNQIVECAENEVTVQAGCQLYKLLQYLYDRDMDLEFIPSNVEGTIAGLISTGAHCHYKYGGIFSQLVTGLELIDGRGQLKRISDAPELKILRTCAGLMGIITLVKLRIQPKKPHLNHFFYNYLTYEEWKKAIQTHMCSYDHVRFYWINTIPKYVSMDYIHPFESGKELMETVPKKINSVDCYANYRKMKKWKPILIFAFSKLFKLKHIVQIGLWLYQRTFVTRYAPNKTLLMCNFTNSLQYFLRMLAHEYGNIGEWSLPVEHGARFIDEIDQLFKSKFTMLDGLIFMFRYCGKNDAVLLSPPYKQDMLYLEIKSNFSIKNTPYMHQLAYEITELGKKYGIKYHLAKQSRGEKYLTNMTPQAVDQLQAYKEQLDPERLFSNEWTKYHFGY